jgi:hypothetical protein
VEIERLVETPAALDKCKKRINAAPDNYNVEWITVFDACLVCGATAPARRRFSSFNPWTSVFCGRSLVSAYGKAS